VFLAGESEVVGRRIQRLAPLVGLIAVFTLLTIIDCSQYALLNLSGSRDLDFCLNGVKAGAMVNSSCARNPVGPLSTCPTL